MNRDFFNRQAHTWDRAAMEKDDARLSHIAARLGITPGARVLDVGTGTGVLLPYLVKLVGAEGSILAADFAREMLTQARAKGFPGDIEFLCTDVVRLPLKSERMDSVVCFSCFPHFRDKPAALREIERVLKPGGTLAICHSVSRSRINEIHSQIPAVAKDLIPDGDEMRRLLSGAGFTGTRITDGEDGYLCRADKPDRN